VRNHHVGLEGLSDVLILESHSRAMSVARCAEVRTFQCPTCAHRMSTALTPRAEHSA
jgi:hypothetical protein